MWYGRIQMIDEEKEEGIATLHRAEYVVSDSEFELIQDTAKDFWSVSRRIRTSD